MKLIKNKISQLMKADMPQGYEFEEGQIEEDDAQKQFAKEQQQMKAFKEKERSRDHNKPIANEEQKMDFQKLYQMQKKSNYQLKAEIQRLTLEFEVKKKRYEIEKDGIKHESFIQIQKLKNDEERWKIINENNRKVLSEKLKEQSQKLKEKQEQLQSCKLEMKKLLEKAQFSIQKKDQQIAELTQKLKDVEHQTIQKLKQIFFDFRRRDLEISNYQEKLAKTDQQNMIINKKLEQLQQQLQLSKHQNGDKQTEISKLNQMLKEGRNQTRSLPNIDTQTRISFNEKKFSEVSIDNHPLQQIIIDSLILQNQKEIKSFLNMFENKKAVGLNLLFRASDNQFDTINTKKKYCGIPHTVLLIKTEYGKIIGGYTSLKWKNAKRWFNLFEWQRDPSGESFIFSISNNHKFTLKSPKYHDAIGHNYNYGPTFNGGICISDSSYNKIKSSVLWFDQSPYKHPEYKAKDKESWIKFSGSSDGKFYTEQWEVHQVVFEEE